MSKAHTTSSARDNILLNLSREQLVNSCSDLFQYDEEDFTNEYEKPMNIEDIIDYLTKEQQEAVIRFVNGEGTYGDSLLKASSQEPRCEHNDIGPCRKCDAPSAHTPGPWHIAKQHRNLVFAGGIGICKVNSAGALELKEESANAHLIAASPELLGASVWILGWLKELDMSDKPIALMSDLQQAISKAKGETT